jgi:cysteine desulfurase
MSRLYLDWNATAPLRDAARAAVLRSLNDPPGNPGSVHSAGHAARMAIETARAEVAGFLACPARDLVFTAGGTESNNLAIHGAAAAAPDGARRIVTSAFEHPSVLRVLEDLELRGFDVVRIAPDGEGRVAEGAVLDAAIPGRTALVSLMLANNEIGTIQPVAAVARELRARGVPCHTDAVQAAGRMPIDVAALGVDLLSIAAHKIGGFPGAGALYVREGLPWTPLLLGGGQESNRRPGTENVPAIAAFGAAASDARAHLPEEIARMGGLRQRLESGVADRSLEAQVNGARAPRLPNTSSVFFPGLSAEALVIALDLEGVAVSAGSACSSGTLRHSPSLLAMGRPAAAAASVRISLGPSTTEAEIDRFLDRLEPIVRRMRAVSRQPVSVS